MPTKPVEKDVKFNAAQSSSAATVYGGVDESWIAKIKGSFAWFKIPQFDIKKGFEDFKAFISRALKSDLPKEIGNAIIGNLKELLGQGKQEIKKRIGSLIEVGGKALGQLITTNEGKGLAIFGTLSALFIGGGVLLGAGPEVITAMLKFQQLTYAFNFNQTDEEIEKELEGSITSLYASAGQALGSGLASLLTGGVFKIPRVQINMTKISIVFRALNEEARTQLMSQVRNLARTSFFTGLRMMGKIFYRSTRKWLKTIAKENPNHPLIKLIPGGAKTVALWGEKGQPAWSPFLYVTKKIEAIAVKNKDIAALLENALESFGESIQEFLPELVRQPIA
ncbi:hypothetical protein QUA82_09900 [Microcoleus sp. F8-D3]